MIRKAEPRDLPRVIELFHLLLQHLKKCGQWAYHRDQQQFENGVAGYVASKLFGSEEHIVLVSENDNGQVEGFLIGWIIGFAPFFQFQTVAELQWLYPLSWKCAPSLRNAFEDWAKAKGATARSNYITPGNEVSEIAMKRDGSKLAFHYYFNPFETGE